MKGLLRNPSLWVVSSLKQFLSSIKHSNIFVTRTFQYKPLPRAYILTFVCLNFISAFRYRWVFLGSHRHHSASAFYLRYLQKHWQGGRQKNRLTMEGKNEMKNVLWWQNCKVSVPDGGKAHLCPSARGTQHPGQPWGQVSCPPSREWAPGAAREMSSPVSACRAVLCGKHKLFWLFPQNELNECFMCRFSVSLWGQCARCLLPAKNYHCFTLLLTLQIYIVHRLHFSHFSTRPCEQNNK